MAYTSSKIDWDEDYENSPEQMNRIEANIKAMAEQNMSFDGDKTFTGSITCTTVNTGQGDNELYEMNQDVATTDNVTFNTVTTSVYVSTPYSIYPKLSGTVATLLHSTSNTTEAALWSFLSAVMVLVNTGSITYYYHLRGGFDSTKIVTAATKLSSTSIRLYWFRPDPGTAGTTDITSTGSNTFGQLSLHFS